MKIKPEHYRALEGGLIPLPDAGTGLTFKRLRWDALRNSTIEGKPGITWICDNLYSYMNDEHIDTALRKYYGHKA